MTGNILFLFTKCNKDHSQAEKYYPISLTSIRCKIMEHISFMSCLNGKNILIKIHFHMGHR